MASHGEQLESNIVATVATAEAVLAHFEQSLVASGFAEGATSYARLADTLIGQRLWAETSGMAHDARFAAVAAHARAIHSLLLPYVQAFQRLGALGVANLLEEDPPASVDAPDVDPLDTTVLDAIERAGRPMSVTALRAAVGAPKHALVATLDRLASTGQIERRQVSGRELIRRSAG